MKIMTNYVKVAFDLHIRYGLGDIEESVLSVLSPLVCQNFIAEYGAAVDFSIKQLY